MGRGVGGGGGCGGVEVVMGGGGEAGVVGGKAVGGVGVDGRSVAHVKLKMMIGCAKKKSPIVSFTLYFMLQAITIKKCCRPTLYVCPFIYNYLTGEPIASLDSCMNMHRFSGKIITIKKVINLVLICRMFFIQKRSQESNNIIRFG